MEPLKHIGLFEGIGGFSLAARMAGWETVAVCEIDKFCQSVLKYHFPKAELYEDIKETDFTKYRGSVDIISGGFPCQPFSAAGKRAGTEDNRYLWPEYLRVIQEVRPKWIVAENVDGLITMENGKVIERILNDLENEAYQTEVYVIPACGVEAIHRRYRVWIVAHSESDGSNRTPGKTSEETKGQDRHETEQSFERSKGWTNSHTPSNRRPGERPTVTEENREQGPGSGRNMARGLEGLGGNGVSANTNDPGLQGGELKRTHCQRYGEETHGSATQLRDAQIKSGWPTEPPVCSADDGLSEKLDGITFPKLRKESLKAYGNAVHPGVVLEIFKAINDYDT